MQYSPFGGLSMPEASNMHTWCSMKVVFNWLHKKWLKDFLLLFAYKEIWKVCVILNILSRGRKHQFLYKLGVPPADINVNRAHEFWIYLTFSWNLSMFVSRIFKIPKNEVVWVFYKPYRYWKSIHELNLVYWFLCQINLLYLKLS